ncbi:hypothetical protein [Pseudomonas helvetica]|uniref:hypothetical protein n=1 Tax=Pseudomonas helvetica TaxID=3136738 RepID=UPI003267DF87
MPNIVNTVAVDWRSGKDRCYFFFKDTNTFSRFNNADDEVPAGYPTKVNEANWQGFHSHATKLRFGFHYTEGAVIGDDDRLYLFYYEGNIPTICSYNQDKDKVETIKPISSDNRWKLLAPHFQNIITATWWSHSTILLIMNDGHYLRLNIQTHTIEKLPINNNTWQGLDPYKYEIVTAVQFDNDLSRNYYYIFLTENRYLKYDMQDDLVIDGPNAINDYNWKGLLRN